MNTSELILYHGSQSIVEKPEYGKGKPYNDYGLGFYCTESIELAKEWAVPDNKDGYANKYILNKVNLSILDLSSEGYSALHWISLLIQNRAFRLKSNVARLGKEYLIENFSLPIGNYDVIKGYRADDSYFLFAENFLNNTITIEQLSKALYLGNLGEQIVLKSENAFHNIEFVGFEIAKSNIYYPLRMQRNDSAREKYISIDKEIPNSSDLYLSDIMKGGVK